MIGMNDQEPRTAWNEGAALFLPEAAAPAAEVAAPATEPTAEVAAPAAETACEVVLSRR